GRRRHRRRGPSRPGDRRVRLSPVVPSVAVLSAGSGSTPWYDPLPHAWPSPAPAHLHTPSTSPLPGATPASTMRAQDTNPGWMNDGCDIGAGTPGDRCWGEQGG